MAETLVEMVSATEMETEMATELMQMEMATVMEMEMVLARCQAERGQTSAAAAFG